MLENVVNNDTNNSNNVYKSVWTRKTMSECQPYWITIVHVILGGQRLQVTAGIKIDSIKMSSSGEELVLQTEKTIRANLEGLPIPEILQVYISYWAKYVASECRKRDTIQSIWLTGEGEPMEYKEISKSIKKVVKIFNPDLHVTAIQFRRMAITNFYKRSLRFIEANVKNISDWLNVSEEVMRQYYNRATAHKRIRQFYQETTGMLIISFYSLINLTSQGTFFKH
jgi:hypothetical protein